MTLSQVSAILLLLQAFGVSPSLIATVQSEITPAPQTAQATTTTAVGDTGNLTGFVASTTSATSTETTVILLPTATLPVAPTCRLWTVASPYASEGFQLEGQWNTGGAWLTRNGQPYTIRNAGPLPGIGYQLDDKIDPAPAPGTVFDMRTDAGAVCSTTV